MRIHQTADERDLQRSTPPHTFNLEVASIKYLGVTVANDLSWSQHIAATAERGNAPLRIKEVANTSMVRSGMEYNAAVWDLTFGRTSGSWNGFNGEEIYSSRIAANT